MPAITSNNPLGSLFAHAPAFSFYEFRAPEWMVVNPRFVNKGNGQWEYTEGKTVFTMRLPSWDKNFDWKSHYEHVLKYHHKPTGYFW